MLNSSGRLKDGATSSMSQMKDIITPRVTPSGHGRSNSKRESHHRADKTAHCGTGVDHTHGRFDLPTSLDSAVKRERGLRASVAHTRDKIRHCQACIVCIGVFRVRIKITPQLHSSMRNKLWTYRPNTFRPVGQQPVGQKHFIVCRPNSPKATL